MIAHFKTKCKIFRTENIGFMVFLAGNVAKSFKALLHLNTKEISFALPEMTSWPFRLKWKTALRMDKNRSCSQTRSEKIFPEILPN